MPKYKLIFSSNENDSLKKLKNRSADALVIFPDDLTKTSDKVALEHSYTPTKLKLYDDPRKYEIIGIANSIIPLTGRVIVIEHDFMLYIGRLIKKEEL